MTRATHDIREFATDVLGWLESPRHGTAGRDCAVITGWAFARTSRISKIVVGTSARRDSVQYGLRRDDVKAAYPADPAALHSGFCGFIECDPQVDYVEVWCELEDGRSVRLFPKQLTLRSAAREAPSALRHLGARVLGILRPRYRQDPKAQSDPPARIAIASTSRIALHAFLQSALLLRYQHHDSPLVSIVVVLWNQAELTLRCLRAIGDASDKPIELVLVDNHSTDLTVRVLDKIDGAIICRNTDNLGFSVAANIGARSARGKYLLFVNNDAELMPGAIDRLVSTIESGSRIGATGGKLVFPNGRIQEAGSIVWADGSCEAYGRDGNPEAGEFNFRRDVDYCSGAFLLTSSDLFRQLGGFDERFKPAYYEDVDYCVRLWESGYRVVYEPSAAAIHFEFGSSSSGSGLRLQQEQQPLFVSLHRPWLSAQHRRSDGLLVARTRRRGRRSVLVIDDAWPEPRLGAGFPRAAVLLESLVRLDCLVTLYPMNFDLALARSGSAASEIEYVEDGGIAHLRDFLRSRNDFCAVIVSRPHNLQHVKAAIGQNFAFLNAPVIYDAEAVYAVRDIARRRLEGIPLSSAGEQQLIEHEISLANGCAAVLTVSEIERRRFVKAGIQNVSVLGHAVLPDPTPAEFEARNGVLFVGTIAEGTPNEDAALFLIREVMPAVDPLLPLTVIGAIVSDRVRALAGDGVTVLSNVEDLTPYYNAARVFVAPARYSAGIPLKLYEAAARGVPIVCTSQLAQQLNWHSESELIVADAAANIAAAIDRVNRDDALWRRLRIAALAKLSENCTPLAFSSQLEGVLKSVTKPQPPAPGTSQR